MKGKSVSVLSYTIVCWMMSVSGLTWQVSSLSFDFFKYETISQLLINRPQRIRPPAVDMCTQLDQYWNEELDYRVEDLLNQQSEVEMVMNYVNYRIPPDYTYEYYDYPKGKEWFNPMDIIKIEKFLKNKFSCYSFKLQPDYMTDFDYRHLVTDYSRPLIWSIWINRWSTPGRLNNSFWYVFMHPSDQSFYQAENNFYEVYWPDMKNMGDLSDKVMPINRLISLTYQLYQTYLLPPPYNTDCFNFSASGSKWESQAHCFESCFNDTVFTVFGFDSPSIPTFEPSDHRRFRAWLPEYRRFENRCRKKCPMKDCRYNDFIPAILSVGDSFWPEFRLHATNHPVVRQTAVVKMDLTEYVTFVLSCISFWLGFSPLDFLLQAKVIVRMSEKRSRNRSHGIRKELVRRF